MNETQSIDLAWYNEAAILSNTFTELQIDWEGSLGSDHAMLAIAGHPREEAALSKHECDLGFVIDPDKSEEWIRTFKAKSVPHPFQTPPDLGRLRHRSRHPSRRTSERPMRKSFADATQHT